MDNPLIMLLKALIDLACQEVTLAGFDGYSGEASNYYNSSMEYDFAKNMAEYLNQYTTTFLKEIRNRLRVIFLTDSRYEGAGQGGDEVVSLSGCVQGGKDEN